MISTVLLSGSCSAATNEQVARWEADGGALRRLDPLALAEGAETVDQIWAWMVAHDWPGRDTGWMFPNSIGGLRTQSSLEKAWKGCRDRTGITKRFTVHGLRYTFTDLVREAKVDAVVRRALTGHVTESMQRHYSNVDLAEKRDAVAGVHQLVPLPGLQGFHSGAKVSLRSRVGSQVGTLVGTEPESDNGQQR